MKLRVVNREKQDLFNRELVKFEINHEKESTPSRDEIKRELSKELKTDFFVIKSIKSNFGFSVSYGEARVYSKKEDLEEYEPKHLIKRDNKPKKEAKEEQKPEEKKVEKVKEEPEQGEA
jgi:small subunit ribosomal protein S24e